MTFLILGVIFSSVIVLVVIFKVYLRQSSGWCKSQTCLVGKTAIVTGANTGIGYETALDFAKRGARVILACRDEKRGEEARRKIIQETNNENVVLKLINMASFDSVRAFAQNIKETENKIDILVNNAGIGGVGDRRSVDGHVLLMQINYFSAFLLTNLLIGLLKETKSRVVNVSSIAAKYSGVFDVKNIDKFPGIYYVYYHSKLCNILFTMELAQRLKGTRVTTYSLHPGAVKTEIFRHAKGPMRVLLDVLKNMFFKTSEEGAQTTIYCSLERGIEHFNGEHFEDCKRVAPYKNALVPGISKKLWELTQDIVQLKSEEILI